MAIVLSVMGFLTVVAIYFWLVRSRSETGDA